MLELFAVPAAAVINRVRGGGFTADQWPGHARLYAAPAIGIVSYLAGATWLQALAWGVGFLLWSAPAWGRWQDLGRGVEPDPAGPFEIAVEWLASRLPGPLDHASLFLRHLLVLPALGAIAASGGPLWLPLLAPVFALWTVGAYEVARRQSFARPLPVAELLTGAAWGGLIIAAL